MIEDWETLVSAITVRPKGEDIHGDFTTIVSLDDEGGGAFVVVDQPKGDGGRISITPEEWPALRTAIDTMIKAALESGR